MHRRGIDRVISLLGFRPARCLTCMRKFYLRYTIEKVPASVARAFTPKPSPLRSGAVESKPPKRPRAA